MIAKLNWNSTEALTVLEVRGDGILALQGVIALIRIITTDDTTPASQFRKQFLKNNNITD